MSVYCCSDLHGMYGLWKQIKEFLKPEDILYVLGDCGDRGYDGWKIITEVLEHPQVIYLKGNHEDMLIRAFKPRAANDYRLLIHNGGKMTYEDACDDINKEIILKELKRLPSYQLYKSPLGHKVHLSHAGFSPIPYRLPVEYDLIWDRDHCNEEVWTGEPNEYVVHGHTPVYYLNEQTIFSEPYCYCEGHKIDIDMASFYSNKAILFNLDTFDYKTFSLEE